MLRGTKRQAPRKRRGGGAAIASQTHLEITLSAAKAVRKYEIDVCIPLVGSIVVACPPLVISSGRDSRSASRISHRAYGTHHDFLSCWHHPRARVTPPRETKRLRTFVSSIDQTAHAIYIYHNSVVTQCPFFDGNEISRSI